MIPFIDLKSQYTRIADEVQARINAVLAHGQYILGPEVSELEARLAKYTGAKHCISCSSGTDALLMALMAKGVGKGDAVFTTPFTFVATAEVIALLGATPVFVDVTRDTFNMDPHGLEAAIRALKGGTRHVLPRIQNVGALRPAGIIAVDLFGLPADYDEINAIAAQHDLFVIEDAAQSFGATYKGRRAGSLAEFGCTSFFPAKPLGCYGDGGAVFTDNAEMAAKLVSIRVHGQGQDKYENVRLGITGRLDSIQAAVLLPKLSIFDDELKKRQSVAEHYNHMIDTAGTGLATPKIPEGYTSAWAQYSILSKDAQHRQLLQDKLRQAEVPTAIYYPKPLHMQKAFENLGYRMGDFPVSEDCAGRIFSLPMHPYLKETEITQIVNALKG